MTPKLRARIHAAYGRTSASHIAAELGLTKGAVSGEWFRAIRRGDLVRMPPDALALRRSPPPVSRGAVSTPLFARVLVDLTASGVAVRDIGARQCRWPIGEPSDPDFRFCAAPVSVAADGSVPVYCDACRARAVRPRQATFARRAGEGDGGLPVELAGAA